MCQRCTDSFAKNLTGEDLEVSVGLCPRLAEKLLARPSRRSRFLPATALRFSILYPMGYQLCHEILIYG
ncbi:hypothetical protein BKA66DRAFT_145417 [Pyrenochaeta sp. MPI-SDFR-AT-0127]|nr:hypothetical protein BKA66DRAFT_145417 [Pyrenochaeta sp. MPI-SDFR-AT-0127]